MNLIALCLDCGWQDLSSKRVDERDDPRETEEEDREIFAVSRSKRQLVSSQ